MEDTDFDESSSLDSISLQNIILSFILMHQSPSFKIQISLPYESIMSFSNCKNWHILANLGFSMLIKYALIPSVGE
jgi:hypothetical protein